MTRKSVPVSDVPLLDRRRKLFDLSKASGSVGQAVPLLRCLFTALALIGVYGPRCLFAAEIDSAVLQAEAERIAAVKKASPTVLAIFANGGQGGGSGVVISHDGYALSNFHVTKECGAGMKCGMADGKLYDAVIVGFDPVGDLAMIKLFGRDDFPAAEMGDSDLVQVGDWAYAMGNPFLLATDYQPSVSYGVVSGTHRYQYPAGTLLEYADCLQVDASINPGNSGGPLFNAQGQLIGINGRGSFEKRGRVNVGVGYAISINQIKNFLGYLKSGRILDHATLGARMASDDRGRVVVNNVLESSDAYRRGLRYDDEIVSFAGRPMRSVNVFKNTLGIYPKGWRVPLTYRREGKKEDVLVRLAGVHREEELIDKALGRGPADPKNKPKGQPKPKTPPMPDQEPGQDDDKTPDPEAPGPMPPGGPKPIRLPHAPAAALPQVVKDHYETRAGYANYYFNKLNQERVWKANLAKGDFSEFKGDWTLTGKAPAGEVKFQIGDAQATLVTPGGEAKIAISDVIDDLNPPNYSGLNPPNSGGLLASLHLWRKLLIGGVNKFGAITYLGTAPLPGKEGLADVLVGTTEGVEVWFYFDPAEGTLLALEMYPDEHADPCEIYFQYKEANGRFVPQRIEVIHGNQPYGVFTIDKVDLGKAAN